jgi:hypothetical protein
MKTSMATCLQAVGGTALICIALISERIPSGIAAACFCAGIGNFLLAYWYHKRSKSRPPVSFNDWEDMVIQITRLRKEQDRQLLKINWNRDCIDQQTNILQKISDWDKKADARLSRVEKEVFIEPTIKLN